MWCGVICQDGCSKPQLPPQLSAGSLSPIRHWETVNRTLGRRREALIREPGNLPFNRRRAGGALWPFIDAGVHSRIRRDVPGSPGSSDKHPPTRQRTGCLPMKSSFQNSGNDRHRLSRRWEDDPHSPPSGKSQGATPRPYHQRIRRYRHRRGNIERLRRSRLWRG